MARIGFEPAEREGLKVRKLLPTFPFSLFGRHKSEGRYLSGGRYGVYNW